jgi:cold shock CspA family protein
MATTTGTIRELLGGFGFIAPDDGGRAVFFHRHCTSGEYFSNLQIGDRVAYEPEPSDRGPRAGVVRRIKE